MTKNADGDSVVFCIRNGMSDTMYGGNWMVTCCIALTAEGALLTAPNIGAGTKRYTVNDIHYYLGMQGTNSLYGGATDITTPIGVPIFEDWYITSPNNVPTQAMFEEILETLGIRVN